MSYVHRPADYKRMSGVERAIASTPGQGVQSSMGRLWCAICDEIRSTKGGRLKPFFVCALHVKPPKPKSVLSDGTAPAATYR
jgi:hypothetical protein